MTYSNKTRHQSTHRVECRAARPARIYYTQDQRLNGGASASPRLDAEQFAPGIAPQMFILLIELAAELGVTPERLCAGLGCTVAGLRSGQEISKRQAWRLIRRALRLTGRADLGLEVGIRQNLSHFGLPGLAMSAACARRRCGFRHRAPAARSTPSVRVSRNIARVRARFGRARPLRPGPIACWNKPSPG